MDDETLTPEQVREWVSRHLANAPERSESWGEAILATYLGNTPARPLLAA